MEKMSLLIPQSTVEMLHLLARDSGQTIGTVVHEMALERYMNRALETTLNLDVINDAAPLAASK